MTYLKYLPKMNYTLGNRNIEVSDIFRRIAFSQETRENPQNWKTFNANSTQTVDGVALEQYDDPSAYWQIMMMNNICTRSDAPPSYIQVQKTQEAYDQKMSFYLPNVNSSNRPVRGDYFVSFDSLSQIIQYQQVERYDSVNRVVFCTERNIYNWGSLTILHARRTSNGSVPVRTLTVSKTGSFGNGLYGFNTKDGDISSYYVPSTNSFISPDTEDITDTNCLLDLFIRNQTLPTGYTAKNVKQKYSENITERRNLKIPPASLVSDLSAAAEDLLKNGNAGSEQTISGVVFAGSTNTDTIQ